MKRVFTLGLTATMLVALTFTNCKDDDEEYEPMKAGVLNEKTGLRVSQCASPSGDVYKFFYKSTGWIEQIEATCADGTSETADFSYSPNKISIMDYDENGIPEDGDDIAISYNGKGYISEIEYNVKVEDVEGYSGSGDMKITESYSYDGEYLSAISHTEELKYEYYELARELNAVYNVKYTLTWNDGKLQKILYEDEETTSVSGGTLDKEKKTSIKETATLAFAYKNPTKNIWGQWAQSQTLLFAENEDLAEMFAYVGLLGKGSSTLPSAATCTTKVVETSETGKKTSSENTLNYNFAHALNKANAIYSTTINDVVYKFGYDYAEVVSAKAIGKGDKLRSGARFTKRNIQSKLRDF